MYMAENSILTKPMNDNWINFNIGLQNENKIQPYSYLSSLLC